MWVWPKHMLPVSAWNTFSRKPSFILQRCSLFSALPQTRPYLLQAARVYLSCTLRSVPPVDRSSLGRSHRMVLRSHRR